MVEASLSLKKCRFAAAKNNSYAETIIGWLIDCGNGGGSAIPEKVMITTVGNGDCGFSIVKQFLAREKDLHATQALGPTNSPEAESQKTFAMLKITEKVIAAAAREWRRGASVLETFLEHYPGLTVTVTRGLVRGVAEGYRQKRQRMLILLTKFRAVVLTGSGNRETAQEIKKGDVDTPFNS
jgi:hypothetical protein